MATVLPQVDHFMQYKVTSIERGEGDRIWTIVFENGGKIHSYDQSFPPPTDAIIGKRLGRTVFSRSQTELQFGRVNESSQVFNVEAVAVLNPSAYSVEVSGAPEHWPQRPIEDQPAFNKNFDPSRAWDGESEEG